MIKLFLFLALAICVSFLCSILEAVLLSITPTYIATLENKGKKYAAYLEKLKSNIDRPLAAILSLNTIAHTIGAAGVGAQAAIVFGDAYLGIVSGVLTLLILIFSEIIPKTLGANYWKSLDQFTAVTLRPLIFLMYPLVLLSQVITKILSKKDSQPKLSRDEVSAMADIGKEEGIFEESESQILKNLIRLKSIKVEDVMTPRTVMIAASQKLTVEQLYQNKEILRFSRIPVFEKDLDHVTGYIHKHDLLDKLASDEHQLPLTEITRELLIVSEHLSIPQLFDRFMEKREQIALAVDEYGAIAGLVTMEDVVETLLGMEIVDEFDNDQDMQALAREKWRKRAEKLGILPDERDEQLEKEKEQVIKFGITGGEAPEDPESGPKE